MVILNKGESASAFGVSSDSFHDSKIQAIKLHNIISLACLFVKKKPHFRNAMGPNSKRQVPHSGILKCAMQVNPTFPKLFLFYFRKAYATLPFSALHLNTHRGYKLCSLKSPWHSYWQIMKIFGLMIHLRAAISTSQPNTITNAKWRYQNRARENVISLTKAMYYG